jgi:hypothetical protein
MRSQSRIDHAEMENGLRYPALVRCPTYISIRTGNQNKASSTAYKQIAYRFLRKEYRDLISRGLSLWKFFYAITYIMFCGIILHLN